MKLSSIASASLLLVYSLASSVVCAADAFPARTVKVVVPSSVGGGADIVARQISAGLQQAWSQSVVVENRVGGGGNIGSLEVVRAPADGYTLLIQNSTMVTNYAISPKKAYSPETDLTPIMLVGVSPLAVFATSAAGIGSMKELFAAAHARPGTLSYASCGSGTPHHFAMELIKMQATLDIQHVGYKGCGPAITDVVGGHMAVGIATANMVSAHAASGRIKPLGVSGAAAYRLLPGVPTFASQGLDIQDFSIWYALMGPSKMSPALVAQITAAVEKVLDNPAVKDSLAGAGVEALRGGPQELAKLIRDQSAQLTTLATKASIQAD